MNLGMGLNLTAFRGGSEPVYDPAVLNATGWWRASYAGTAPHAGIASAGSSGSRPLIEEAARPLPVAGVAVNGFAPFRSITGYGRLGCATALSTLLPVAGHTAIALVYNETPVAPGAIYSDATVWGENVDGDLGLAYTTDGLTYYGYSGGYNTANVPLASCPAGAWHYVVCRKTATHLKISVDLAADVTTACGDIGGPGPAASGFGLMQHYNFGPTGVGLIGSVLELMTFDSILSDADCFTNIPAYVLGRYGLAF